MIPLSNQNELIMVKKSKYITRYKGEDYFIKYHVEN